MGSAEFATLRLAHFDARKNQMTDANHPDSKPSFTAKQGQYLAFIYAYTCIMRRPPAEADMQRHFQVAACPPRSGWLTLTHGRTK